MKNLINLLIGCSAIISLTMLGGCGGGGGGGGSSTPPSTPVSYKFRTYSSTITNFGTYSGIKAIGFRVDLPVGVSVPTDSGNARQTAVGALKYSGVLATTFKNVTSKMMPRPLYAGYSAAKPAGSGKDVLWISLLVNDSGLLVFDKGEFLTLNALVAPGANGAKSGVSISSKQIDGNYIGSSSNDLTAKYKLGLF